MIRRPIRHVRNRGVADPSNRDVATFANAVASIVAAKFRLTFDVPVNVKGLPAAITVNGLAPTGFSIVSPTVLDLDYAADVAPEQDWVIPNRVKQIRTSRGGYVASATGTF